MIDQKVLPWFLPIDVRVQLVSIATMRFFRPIEVSEE